MKAWTWLIYPLAVVLVVAVSADILFGNLGLWNKLSARQAQIQQNAEISAKLRAKLAKLQSVNLATEHQNLDYLLAVLPPSKNLPVLLSQIQQAASVSGAIFEGFRGKVGEVAASASATSASDKLELEVTLQVGDINQLQQTLAALETGLPLVKITQIKLAAGRAILTVLGLWSGLTALPAGAQYAVADTTAGISKLRDQLTGYTSLPPAEAVIDTSGVNPNPF